MAVIQEWVHIDPYSKNFEQDRLEKIRFCDVINPQAAVAQKIADAVVSDVSKVKESSFFSDLTDSPQIFDEHLLENTD